MLKRFAFALAVLVTSAQFALAGGGDDLTLQGRWVAQSYVGVAGAAHEWLPSINVGVGYNALKQLSLNAELAGYAVIQDGPDAGAGEFRLMLRHHFLVRDRWTIFADVGFGIIEASDQVPDGGTRQNFVFRSGLGATYELSDNLYLLAGVRYWHLSNAKIEGDERNPSINGVEGYAGVMWLLK